jgi:hypothetical protein
MAGDGEPKRKGLVEPKFECLKGGVNEKNNNSRVEYKKCIVISQIFSFYVNIYEKWIQIKITVSSIETFRNVNSHVNTTCRSIRVTILIIFQFVRRQMSPRKVQVNMFRQHETLDCGKLHKHLSNSFHISGKRHVWQLNGIHSFENSIYLFRKLYFLLRIRKL